MPTYEYACAKCGQKTEVFASIVEKEKGLKVSCPKCGSKKMVQFFGKLNVLGGFSGSPGGGFCGSGSGPGCCG